MPHDGLTGIYFDSLGYRLLGRLFMAPGDDPKPTALILHGLAGIEQNHDIAFALREHGWNAVIFHYRGCWGSTGVYNFETLPDDTRACLDHLSSGEYPIVDPERLVLIGHSMGGWTALMTAAVDTRPRAVLAIAPVVTPAGLDFDATPEGYAPWLPSLGDEGFVRTWRALRADPSQNALAGAARIAPRPLYIVHARQDGVVPVAQSEALYGAAGEPRCLIVHEEANHSFTAHRPWLRETLIGWLDGLTFDE